MIRIAVALGLCLFVPRLSALQGQDPRVESPKEEAGPQDPKKIPEPREALALLEEARKTKDPAKRAGLVEHAGRRDDRLVARALGPFLADKEAAVRKAAILALRYMRNEEALKTLLKAAKRFEKDKETGPDFYLALGQQGREAAIPVLEYRAWNPQYGSLFRARIQALAHIRSRRSLKALERISRKFRRHGWMLEQIKEAFELLVDERPPKGRKKGRRSEIARWIQKKVKEGKVAIEPRNLPRKILQRYERTWRRPGEKKDGGSGKKKRKARKKGGGGSSPDQIGGIK